MTKKKRAGLASPKQSAKHTIQDMSPRKDNAAKGGAYSSAGRKPAARPRARAM